MAMDLEAILRLTAKNETAEGLRQASRGMKGFAKEQEGMFGELKKSAMGAVAAIGSAEFLRRAYTNWAQLDRQITLLRNTLGGTEVDVRKVQRAIQDLARTGVGSQQELIDSAKILDDYLNTNEKSVGKINQQVAEGARAAGVLPSEMARAFATTAKAFDIQEKDYERIIADMVVAAQQGNLDIQEMTRQWPLLAEQAAKAGYTGEKGLRQWLTVLGTLKQEAGAPSKQTFSALIDMLDMTSERTSALEKNLRIVPGTISHAMKDAKAKGQDPLTAFASIIAQLKRAGYDVGKELTPLQRTILEKLADPKVKQRLTEFWKSMGDAPAEYAKQQDELAHDQETQLKQLEAQWEEFEETIGEVMVQINKLVGPMTGNPEDSLLGWIGRQLHDMATGAERVAASIGMIRAWASGTGVPEARKEYEHAWGIVPGPSVEGLLPPGGPSETWQGGAGVPSAPGMRRGIRGQAIPDQDAKKAWETFKGGSDAEKGAEQLLQKQSYIGGAQLQELRAIRASLTGDGGQGYGGMLQNASYTPGGGGGSMGGGYSGGGGAGMPSGPSDNIGGGVNYGPSTPGLRVRGSFGARAGAGSSAGGAPSPGVYGRMKVGGSYGGGAGGEITSSAGGSAVAASGGGSAAQGTYRPVYTLHDRDMSDAVVNTIAGEAYTNNQQSVDAVINNMLNRVGTKGYGPSGDLQSVARAHGQYAGYRRANPKEAAYIRSRIQAIASGGEPDITGGSNEYRAGWYKGPWGRKHANSPVIGGNRFGYNPKGGRGTYSPYPEPHMPAEAGGGGGDDITSRARRALKPPAIRQDVELNYKRGPKAQQFQRQDLRREVNRETRQARFYSHSDIGAA